jgi:cytochrome c551/c552
MRRIGLGLLGILVALGVGIQLVPYGHERTNPPVRKEPAWDTPTTQDLANRACYDCHSNQTVWPWYSKVAPISWLIQNDVDNGRKHLNFSEWDHAQRRASNAGKRIQRGSMPPWYYILMHSTANLSPTEKETLARGLEATLGKVPSAPAQAKIQDTLPLSPVVARNAAS